MNRDKQKQLVDLLGQLEPGYLPLDIFIQIARLAALSIVEFVPLRTKNGKLEVLLLARGSDDAIWPGELHTPGTVIRPTDTQESMSEVFDRILKDELGGTQTSEPHYVSSLLHKSRRGTEHAQIYWVEVLDEPKAGKFYQLDNLPAIIIESQVSFINEAANDFITRQKKAF